MSQPGKQSRPSLHGDRTPSLTVEPTRSRPANSSSPPALGVDAVAGSDPAVCAVEHDPSLDWYRRTRK